MQEVKKKRSNLVMPTHYQELTREEMEYVDGGSKISDFVALLTLCCAGFYSAGVYVKQTYGRITFAMKIAMTLTLTPLSYVAFMNGYNSVK